MFIAFIVIFSLLLIFIVVTYFIMRKTFKFELNGKNITIKNAGAYIKIYENDKLVESFYMPNLIKGESYSFKIDEKEYTLKCKSNSFGNKISMQVYENEDLIADNGVNLENTKKLQKTE